MSFAPGTNLGPYRILALLGKGGMGEVYRAEDPKLGREVAVKVLPEAFAEDGDRLRRFEREARVLASLAHPNILDIHDFAVQDGRPYLVMELLEGTTLRQKLEAAGALPPSKAAETALQVARGLAAAHEKGVLHRDLKPENIFLCRDGRVKILDFGLAKLHEPPVGPESLTRLELSDPALVVGTPGYASPEQIQGLPLDARSDLFALGVVLWEALTGRHPFRRDTLIEMLHAVLKEEAPDLDPSVNAPPGLGRILDRCLAKDPAARFHSAHDLVFALEALSSGSQPAGAPWTSGRRRPYLLAAAASVVLVLGLAAARGGVWLGFRRKAPPTFQQLTYREGMIPAARFVPGGEEILLSADWVERGTFDLYGLRLGHRELTPTGLRNTLLQAVSPSGEVLMTTDLRQYSYFGSWGRMGLGRTRALAPRMGEEGILSADMAPDGRVAVSRRTSSGTFRLECPPGTVRLEGTVDCGDLRFSPDGRRLAFIERPRSEDSLGRVGLLDLGTGQHRVLTQAFPHIIGIAWRGGEVWFTAAEQGVRKALWGVTPSGRTRLVLRTPSDLTVMDIAPDGRVLLNAENMAPRIYLARAGALDPLDLTDGWYPVPLTLASDGSRFLYLDQTQSKSPNYDLYLQPLPSGPALYLGQTVAYAALSPDGSKVVAFQEGPPHPLVISLATGEVRHLPGHGLADYPAFPRWTPDGRAFYFRSWAPGEPRRIYLQDGQTGALSPLGPVGMDGPLMTPDARRLLGRFSDGWKVVDLLHPEGAPEAVRGMEGLNLRTEQVLDWTADGTRLLMCRIQPGAVLVEHLDPRTGIRKPWARFSTGGVPLRRWGAPPRMTPDGKLLLFSSFTWESTLFLVEGLE